MSLTSANSPRNLHTFLIDTIKRVWPRVTTLSGDQQAAIVGSFLTVLYTFPIGVIGVIVLVGKTELGILFENWGTLLLLAVLMIIFDRLRFFLIVELRVNRYGTMDGSLTGMIKWSSILLFGIPGIWLEVILRAYEFVSNMLRTPSTIARWNHMRNFTLNLASSTTITLITLWFFQSWGGSVPLTEWDIFTVALLLAAFLVNFVLDILLSMGYLVYNAWIQVLLTGSKNILPMLKFFFLAVGLPHLAHPFGVFAIGLYLHNDVFVYLLFTIGMILVAVLSRRLSLEMEGSRQQSRMLQKLEMLSQAIIGMPPEEQYLRQAMEENMYNMFPSGKLVIWKFPNEILYKHTADWDIDLNPIWTWLLGQPIVHAYTANERLPWNENDAPHDPVITLPILDFDGSNPIGGIYIELHTLVHYWDHKAIKSLLPAAQSLASQISSALHQIEVFEQSVEFQRVTQELKIAGTIQSNLLPYVFPSIPGWELAVSLEPAGETSGDFFDVIPLDDGKFGFVIADVLDKGVGPALYMTLSRTLIRTYAIELDSAPDTVFFATNRRILIDTATQLFVTAFYGVLDTSTGTLTYSNAGHNPPFLISPAGGNLLTELSQTGYPIGIDENATWGLESIQLQPGDVLVMYTDGIPEAQNLQGDFFEEKPLAEAAKANLGNTAEAIHKNILDEVRDFVGDAPQFDDITLMVLSRNT